MVYTPAAIIIAAAALNVASTVAIPVDTGDNSIFIREPEPLFGIGAVAKIGSKIGGKIMHKAGHKKAKHAAEGAEAVNDAQQSNRRSLDSDEFDELVARDEESELEAREPEPLFGIGAVAKIGSKIGGKIMHKAGHKKAKHAAEGAEAVNDAQQSNRRSLDSDEFDELVARDEEFELEAREPEPLFGIGAVAKIGSKIGGKIMHKAGHKKAKHAAEGAEAVNDAQQSNRRSLDSDEFDELVARDEEFELEAREPEPLFGIGAVAKIGSKIGGKIMHKAGHKKAKHAAEGAEAANEAQQSNRRSLDSDEFDELVARDEEFELEARDFDELDELVARDEEFELEAREPEPLFGIGAVAKIGSKIGGKIMHKAGHKKAKHAAEGAEAVNEAQQSNRRSLEYGYDLDELD